MNADELKSRTKQFAIDIGMLSQSLPENKINRAYCNQIIGFPVPPAPIIELPEEPGQRPIILTN